MATPIFCCGFECGVSGSHFTHGSSFSFSTTTVRSGARSLRCLYSAQNGSSLCNITLSNNIIVGRFYVRFTTLPTLDLWLINFSDGSNLGGVRFKSTDNKIYAEGGGAAGATGISVTTEIWYRVDFRVNMTSNPRLYDVQVDGVEAGQASDAFAATTATSFTVLNGTGVGNMNADVFMDDLIISGTTGDYPFGPGFVHHFVPTSDGTHNVAGTNDFERTLTGTDILNATTDAYLLVDKVPLPAAVDTFINMVVPPNATDYVQCKFGPAPGIITPKVAPRTVEVIAAIHQAGTGTGNMTILLNDNGTTGTVYTATTVAGTTTLTYKRAHFADPPSAATAWTLSGNGDFNNLQVRFGSPAAVDANPDQYFDSIMVEAEFAPLRVPRLTSIGHPFNI